MAWPLLAASLGADWSSRFTTWAETRPPLGPVRDGWDFARALADAGDLPESTAGQLAQREAAWRYDGHHAPRKRRLHVLRHTISQTWVRIHQPHRPPSCYW
jgi:hypothetical protein